MSHCLNPYCTRPQNPDTAKFCSSCGFKLLLGDRYRTIAPIARGGFGRTFLAVDEYKPSRPKCVIKQFFPQNLSVQDPIRARELFQREAIQLEQLGQHPQIPELYAHFEQAGYQYLVQEFIEGQNLLQELARSGAFSEVQVGHLLNDLLPVLEFIHSQQVIHRDIKPQNIIRRSANQQYVLVDFGAAKSIEGFDPLCTGTSIGSPEFTAPEQAIGKATFASDLYSLGVTCIYLLTQVRPADLFDTSEGGWVWQPHLTSPVNGRLGNLLDRLLQTPIKLRYQSASDVLRDVKALDFSEPSERSHPPVQPPSTEESGANAAIAPPPELSPTLLPEAEQSLPQIWRCTRTLTGHTSWVRSVVVHPNGELLASGSGDKTVKLWNLHTGELVRTLQGHTAWVRAIATSPNGKLLASCSNDQTIKLWEWGSGELLQTLKGHSDWVRSVAFSPDGKTLASSSQDKTIQLWHVLTGDPLKTLAGHRHWVTAVAFSPTDKRLISGSRDKTIRVWQWQTGELQRVLEGHEEPVNALAISPDGQILASGSDDATIKLWNLQTGELLQTFTQHQGAVNSLVISPDSQRLISASHDRTVRIWDFQTGELLYTALHPNWVWCVALGVESATAPLKDAIISGSWDSTIKIWQPC